MEIYKKLLLFIAMIFCFVIIGQAGITAEACESISQDILNETGADELIENIEGNAEDFIADNSISAENPESILNIGIEDIFREIADEIVRNIKMPLELFSSLLVIIILSSFTGNLADTVKIKSSEKIFSIICVLVCVTFITEPVSECFSQSADNIKSGAVFMNGFIPVFSGITVAGGGISSAAVYSTLMFIASEFAVNIADSVIMPVLRMCMAMAIVDSVNPAVSLNSLISAIKKLITRLLTFTMMIYTGLLSLQSIIGTSSDSLAIKAGKYVASNFVPVVGSAVSDAYTALKGSIGLLRGGTGSFGIIVILLTIMPSVILSGLYYAAVKCAYIFSDMFGEKNLSRLFSNISYVLEINFSIMICFAVIMIISTAIVMMTGMCVL